MPWSFYILALLTIVSAVCAMSLRNLVHCALCLALTFLGVAGIFLQMQAGFIAFAQILVYVGAVAILIVFVILLTRSREQPESRRASHLLLGIPISLVVALVFVAAVRSSALPVHVEFASGPTVRELGQALMTTYILPLEILGLLLTVALLGAVIIALPEKEPEVFSKDS